MGQTPQKAAQPDRDSDDMDVNAELLMRRQRLISAVQAGGDTQQAAHELICLNCPVSLKYAELDVKQILLDNNKTLNELRQIPLTLYVLEKYGRHLLKPSQNRAEMWRYVKFSNPIFRERVEPLKGARAIMRQLGYREEVEDGLYFSDSCEPDQLYTVNLVADIVLARWEMEAYLGGYHPRPHSLEEFIPTSTREVVHTVQPKNVTAPEVEPSPSPSLFFQSPGTRPLPAKTPPPPTLSQPPSSQAAPLDLSSSPSQPPTPLPHQVCDICGDRSASLFCETCDHKQLCDSCDKKWHSHPKRQQHVRQPLDANNRPPVLSRPPLAMQGAYGLVQNSPERSPSFTPPPPVRIPQNNLPAASPSPSPKLSSPGNVPNLDLLTFHSQPEGSPFPLGEEAVLPGQELAPPASTKAESAPQPDPSQKGVSGDPLPSRPPRCSVTSPPNSGAQGPPSTLARGPPSPHVPPTTHGYVNVTSSVETAPPAHSLTSHGYVNLDNTTRSTASPGPASTSKGPAPDPTVHWPPTTIHQQSSSPGYAQQASASTSSHPGYYAAPIPGSYPSINPQPPQVTYGTLPTPQRAPFPHVQPGYRQPAPGPDPALMAQQYSQAAAYATMPRHHYPMYSAPYPQPQPQQQQPGAQQQQMYPQQMLPSMPSAYMGSPVRFQTPRPAWPPSNNAAAASSSIPLTSMGGEGSLMRSKLLQRVLQEPSREKQQAKAAIHIATLEEEVEELHADMQKIILASENFDQDASYRSLMKRQGMLVREKAELERFLASLEAANAGDNSTPSASAQEGSIDNLHIYYPPTFDVLPGMPASAGASSFVQSNVPPSSRPGSAQPGFPHHHPVLANTSSNAKTSQPLLPAHLQPSGEKGGSIPSGQGVSVGPPRHPQQGGRVDEAVAANKGRVGPPSVNPAQLGMAMPPQPSMPLPSAVAMQAAPLPKRPSSAVFEAAMGGKDATVIRRPSSAGVRGGYHRRWQCEHCTFANEAGTRICDMCDKTSDNPTLIDESPTTLAHLGESEETTLVAAQAPNPHLGRKITEVYDEIYYEKMEAKKKFEAEQRVQMQRERQPPPHNLARENCPPSKSAVPAPVPSTSTPSLASTSATSMVSSSSSAALGSGPLRRTSNPNPASIPASQDNLSFTLSSSSLTESRGSDTSLRGGEMDVRQQLDRISREKELQEMAALGADTIYQVKACDKQGYHMEEVVIALEHCQAQGGGTALQWLNANWKQRVAEVMAAVTEHNQQQEQNDVGEMTEEEVVKALRLCKGNVESAVAHCISARSSLYRLLNPDGQLPREEVLRAMHGGAGCEDRAQELLDQDTLAAYRAHIWEERRGTDHTQLMLRRAAAESCPSIATSVISDRDFEKQVFNKELDMDRRLRMVLVEGRLQGWGRAEQVIRIIDDELKGGESDVECTLEDVVEAVRNCGDWRSAIVYLRQTCTLCFGTFPMSKICNLNVCQCKMCFECMKTNFTIAIREKHVRHWGCPICTEPDWNDEELSGNYLQFLTLMLKTREVDQETFQLLETKVRDWHLQKEENFRWCTHCGNGFIWMQGNERLAMTCPVCSQQTCFNCKRQWEDQHEGITCEQFEQWKIDNDPNNQQAGLAKHLAENGIDCPSCKMRFSLARGGCMHFKCPQCAHEFCSGCSQPFYHDNCSNPRHQGKGLHCHHPRDCFYFLRDNPVEELQKLLKINQKVYNTEVPESQVDKTHCPVVEQKEMDSRHQDESCGKDVLKGHAGLCVNHYKEYLVTLINRDRLDPVTIMSREEIENLLKREEKQMPSQKKESQEAYLKKLMKFVQNQLPLKKK